MKTQSYNRFWQRVHNTARRKSFPLRVMVELTYRCNFFCRHCYVPQSYREKGELTTKEVFLILDQLADIGCLYIGFTGGEPFMRKDILDIVWYAKKKGFEIIIYSNGSLINDRIAKALKEIRPNKVDITIPAMSKAAFDTIVQVRGYHDKLFRAIELLKKYNVSVGFKSCVLKENESEIKEIQDFVHSLKALHRIDTMMSPCLDGSKEPYKYRGRIQPEGNMPQDSGLRSSATRTMIHTDPTLDDNNVKQGIEEGPPVTQGLFSCGVGVSQAAISPLGELKMCLMIDYPKYTILETSLSDCWQRLRILTSTIKPNNDYNCHACELEPYCQWCPAQGWLYNGNFLSCNPENYHRAQCLRDTVLQKNQEVDYAKETKI